MKELWLFTRQYPSGRGEAFLTAAIDVWRTRFTKVVVLPMYRGEGSAALPADVELCELWPMAQAFTPLSLTDTLRRGAEVMALLHDRGDRLAERFKGLGAAQNHARQLLHKAAVVERELMPHYDPARVVVLSTWMEDWVNVLGLLKRDHRGLRIATMAHGWDLFAHRRASGTIPYRSWQMAQVDAVCCIARSGLEHLAAKYPHHVAKLNHTPLGTVDRGAAPWAPDEVLRVVSSAYLRPPKRIHDIATALKQVQRPLRWTHFGDGPLRPVLDSAVQGMPPHVQLRLMGNLPHEAVLHHLATEPTDLFVHLSDDEGVPVAMMEAASVGIPLVANAVGGVPEVLVTGAGELLPAEAGAEELAAWLNGDAPARWCTTDARAGVRDTWRKGFAAATNYGRLADLLMAM